MRCRSLSIIYICLLPFSLADGAEDFVSKRDQNWHQWRGPLANGVSPSADPPIQWNENTNIKWKAKLPGLGSSTPIVWEDQVFLLTAVETDRVAENPPQTAPDAKTNPPQNYYQFVVLSYDRRTGKQLWRHVACEDVPHEGRHQTNTYASFSPMTDGEHLYVSFGSRGLYCYDLNGTPKWSRDLGDMRTRYGWGEATSPVVHGDSLIINWDHEDQSFITKLSAQTGKTLWKRDRDEVTSWATPLVVQHKGRTQVVLNGTNRVQGYDLASGEVIWECGGQSVNAIPSPVTKDGIVFCMSGYRKNFACAIPLDSVGDITNTDKVVWTHNSRTPYVPSPLLLGDRLYFTRKNSAILSCLNAKTGQSIIEDQRLSGLRNLYASPTSAAGRIYFVDRDGTTLVVKHDGEIEELAINKLEDRIDASPALVGNQLFLRGSRYLYCIEER